MSNSTIFNNSINRAICNALTANLPYKCAMNSHISECGLIHVTAFKLDENDREYAEYYLPSTCTKGYRYLDQIPEIQYYSDSENSDAEAVEQVTSGGAVNAGAGADNDDALFVPTQDWERNDQDNYEGEWKTVY
jgi:hypothetical protein